MTFYFRSIRTSICILLLFFSSALCFAQGEPFSIKGVIYDENKVTLPFASIYLFKLTANDKPVKGVQSDHNGAFILPVTAGNFKIQISQIGYKPYVKEVTINGNIDLGKIALVPDEKLLSEVKVTGNKPLISRKVDRYVLNVSGSVLSAGRGTFELLNYAPGVMTMGSSISINGNTATKIMVNGRLLRLSGEQVKNYLDNLRSEDVESIEVIAVPGAEYEAEGSGGLINVVLKKQRSGGFNGSIGLGGTTPIMPSYNTNAQLNYGYKGLQLYSSYNYSRRESEALLEDFRTQEDLSYNTIINVNNLVKSSNLRAGAAYNASKDHYMGIEFTGNTNKFDSRSLSQAVLNDPSANQFNNISGDFLTRRKNDIYTLSFNYDWNIDTLGSSFNVIADYTQSKRNSFGDFQSKYFDEQNVPLFDSVYRMQTPTNVKNYNIAANYVKVFAKAGKLKFGAKYTETDTKNDVYYEYLSDGEFINDAERSNAFQYTERIAAVYGQYNVDWKKTKVQLGARAEHTNTTGVSISSVSRNSRNYLNFFPSVFIKQELSEKHALSFSYSRRLDRPTFNSLNPFEWRIDNYTYISGNPNLNPQYSNSFNLSYLFMNKYDLRIFTTKTNGVFGQYLTEDPASKLVANYKWENLTSESDYGANLYIPVTVSKWWSMVNNFMVYTNTIKFPSGGSTKTTFSGKTTQNISMTDNLKLEVAGVYQSKYNVANAIFGPRFYIDMGLSNTFFKKKLTARAVITDIFNTSRMDYNSISSNLNIRERQKYTTRTFSLQLTYNFNLGKKVKIQKVEGGNQEEKNRM